MKQTPWLTGLRVGLLLSLIGCTKATVTQVQPAPATPTNVAVHATSPTPIEPVITVAPAVVPANAPETKPSAPTKDLVIDLGDGVTMTFVRVPAGQFMMGTDGDHSAESPWHPVTFDQPFYMGRYTVTQAQWQQIMGADLDEYEGADLPVHDLDWNDAQALIEKLNTTDPCQPYSLPSEAQYEYAARAAAYGDYCYGDGEAVLPDYAWYSVNSDGHLHPVGERRPNAWGLYDMHGNIWVWCQDVWHGNYIGAPWDGSAWLQGEDTYRILRGGSWNYDATYLRAARRTFIRPTAKGQLIGVRVVAAVDPP